MGTLLISGGTLVRADGEEKTDILIQDGKVSLGATVGTADQAIDTSGLLIFPAPS